MQLSRRVADEAVLARRLLGLLPDTRQPGAAAEVPGLIGALLGRLAEHRSADPAPVRAQIAHEEQLAQLRASLEQRMSALEAIRGAVTQLRGISAPGRHARGGSEGAAGLLAVRPCCAVVDSGRRVDA